MSYASILRELKKRVNPDELGVTVQGIRETRSKDFLVELKYSDLEPTIEVEDVKDAVRNFFDQELELELKVSLSKTPYRRKWKEYVLLEDARSLELLKGTYSKIRWVSCRVRREKEVNRCFRCLGFGHMAADCRGPDRSRCCWRCGEEGHVVDSCTEKPRCYLCAAREEKPQNDHIPGTMPSAAFREAAPNRKLEEEGQK